MSASPDAEFVEFYQQYPRKTARIDAEKAWQQMRRREPNLLTLCLTALAWQREQVQWQQRDADGVLRWVPHPATYLRSGQFYDEAPAAKADPLHVEFEQWRVQHALDPAAKTVTFDQFKAYVHARRRA